LTAFFKLYKINRLLHRLHLIFMDFRTFFMIFGDFCKIFQNIIEIPLKSQIFR